MRFDARTVLALILLGVLLAGCGRSNVIRRDGGSQAATASASRPASSGAADVVVSRGDTLYGLAFRHGLDYRQVAGWNGIRAPYTIYPGQRISLSPPGSTAAAPSSARAPAAAGPVRAPATRSQPTQASAPAQPVTPATPSGSASSPATASGPVAWRWPADGQLVGRFADGDPTRQGVDIAGQAGQDVRAAAAGTVVYSGSGLVGYGELIIIKHTDEWLSAYGHNRRRLVEEGQTVSGGEKIAEMGRSGASRDMLHFEIRRNGRPVDPLQHLPRR